jgi:hypothetical protein
MRGSERVAHRWRFPSENREVRHPASQPDTTVAVEFDESLDAWVVG